jgi:tetratricopeptide (TPR) repeat protein
VVADFENRTADSTLGASVTEAFRIDLAQSPVINVLAASSVGQALQRMGKESAGRLDASTAREVALRENAKAVVVGEISPVGKGIVLSARLVSAADGSEMVALRETAADETEVLGAIDKLSKGMRERFGESLKRLRNTDPLEQVTTGSLEALRLYTQGARAADEGRYDDGIGLMQQAIAADSTFGMAWRKLAVLLGNTRTSESRRVEAAAQAYKLRDRLPEIERYLADAYYFWTVDYQPEKVVSAYRAVLQINPDEPTSLNNLAIELEREGKHEEAEQLIRRALAGGDVSAFYSVLINVLLARGQGDSAIVVADSMVRRLPGSEGVLFKAGALNSLGRYDSSEVLLRQALGKGLPPSSAQFAHFQLRQMKILQGRLGDAAREKERQQALFERRGQPEGILASETATAMADVTLLGDRAAAVQKLDAALQRVPMASLPVADRPYTWVASVYAMAGRVDRAHQLMQEYEREVPVTLRRGDEFRHAAEGTIAMAEGQPRQALELFRTYTREIGCEPCGKVFEAQAWDAMGEPDSAIAAYRVVATPGGNIARLRSDGLMLTPALRRMGNLQEERGDKAGAIEAYTRVLQNWKQADPVLQPQVQEVKQRLARLTGEPE